MAQAALQEGNIQEQYWKEPAITLDFEGIGCIVLENAVRYTIRQVVGEHDIVFFHYLEPFSPAGSL